MNYKVVLAGLSYADQWEIFRWHQDVNISYCPNIDEHQRVAQYEFEDPDQAMLFKLKFGGIVVEPHANQAAINQRHS